MATLVHPTSSRIRRVTSVRTPAGLSEALLILVLGAAVLALREAGLLTPDITLPPLHFG